MNLFPTSYFPSLLYFQELQGNSEVGISGNETYLKQSFRNRCEILTGNGIQFLSVPVIKPNGSKSLTKEVQISNVTNWRIDHWRAIESAYRSAPYFEFFDHEIKNLIFLESELLIDYNHNIISFFANLWQLNSVKVNSDKEIGVNTVDFLTRDCFYKPYTQVFNDRFEFQSNLSILDLLFCQGPMGRNWIVNYPK
jgi:hypothetical protein